MPFASFHLAERPFAAFRRALTRARKNGELAPGKSPADLARFFSATANGLRVVAKVSPNRKTLNGAVRVALQTLD